MVCLLIRRRQFELTEEITAVHRVTEWALLLHCFGQNPQDFARRAVKLDQRTPGTSYFLKNVFSCLLSCFMLLQGRSPVDVSKLRGCLVRYRCLSGTLTLSTNLPGEDSGIEPSLREDQQLMLFMLFYIFSLSKRGLGLVRLLSTTGTSAGIKG